MIYIHRTLERTFNEYLGRFSSVGVTGPRRSGKSTMIKRLLGGDYEYVTFFDHDNVRSFYEDPNRFMRVHGDHVVFDEIQKVPELFNYVKIAIDEDPQRRGKFVLVGPSQFGLVRIIAESLAGKIGLMKLLPFEFREMRKRFQEESIFRGGYPELVFESYDNFRNWYEAYIEIYMYRDVRDLSNVGDLQDFRRCLELLAMRAAKLLNLSDIARDLDVAVNTVKRWISILEGSDMIFLVHPFHQNYGRRIAKSPTIYFYDTGLVSFLAGIRDADAFERGPMYGAVFENYVVSEIMKREMHSRADSKLFYFCTSNGVEIDLIIDRKTSREFIEIKPGETYRSEMARPLLQFKNKEDQAIVLYRGKDVKSAPDLRIMNYKTYLQHEVGNLHTEGA